MTLVKEPQARLLTLVECADYLGVSKDLIRKAVDSGQIPTVALGTRQWVSTKVLDNFLAVK